MITLSILKYLENAGLGEIDVSLFWEKIGLKEDGLFISDIGEARERGNRRAQTFELYSRGANDVQAYKQLQAAIDLINSSYEVCDLPGIEGITEGYSNVTFMPMSTITNSGQDAQDRTLFTAIGRIYY